MRNTLMNTFKPFRYDFTLVLRLEDLSDCLEVTETTGVFEQIN